MAAGISKIGSVRALARGMGTRASPDFGANPTRLLGAIAGTPGSDSALGTQIGDFGEIFAITTISAYRRQGRNGSAQAESQKTDGV